MVGGAVYFYKRSQADNIDIMVSEKDFYVGSSPVGSSTNLANVNTKGLEL